MMIIHSYNTPYNKNTRALILNISDIYKSDDKSPGISTHNTAQLQCIHSFAAGVLGHSLGALTDCMFGQFTREVKPDCSLDFTAGDSVFLVVVCQAGGLGGDTLKDVVHERVHDAHGLAGDASVGVHLFEDLVDVERVALLARLPFLLAIAGFWPYGGFLFALPASDLARHRVLDRRSPR